MGDSKIVMLSSIYLIIGMILYTNHPAETRSSLVLKQSARHDKAEAIACAGISRALNKMGANRSLNTFPPEVLEMNEGKVSLYAAQLLGASMIQSKITVIGIAGTDTVTMTAIATFDRGRWRLSGVFPLPAV
jgi:hypothetical protein